MSRDETRCDRPGHAALLVAAITLLACGAGSGNAASGGPAGGGSPGDARSGGGAGVYSGGDQPPASTGTIAYAQGDELRLVEPDGTGDHLVWSAPASGVSGVTYHVTAPAWRPNGWEIAFSSDHEMAYSVFERDLYAVRPDGVGLRRLTNAPTREQAATYPKGSVRVTVQNDDVMGTYFTLIVQGADPQAVTVAAGTQQTITVPNVADLGAGIRQGIAAASGTYRWNGPTVDVEAGRTVDAGVMYIHANSTIEGYGAGAPFWRSDSTKVGYTGPYCTLLQAAANPPAGFTYQRMFGIDAFVNACPGEWGPTAATATQLVVADGSEYADTSVMTFVEMTEGATAKPPPVYSLDPFIHVVDLHWLRDGTGFVFARRNSELEYDVNLWEYDFATGTATQITNVQFAEGVMRRFAMSSDGRRIAFEMVDRLYGDSPVIGFCDLYVMNRDGSGLKLLAQGAGYPAWNPLR